MADAPPQASVRLLDAGSGQMMEERVVAVEMVG